MLTQEEFNGWKSDQTTQFFLRYLQDYREQLKEELINGNLTKDRADSTAMKHAEYIGACSILLDIIGLDHASIIEFYKPQKEIGNDRALDRESI
jgi:hypothetical protein